MRNDVEEIPLISQRNRNKWINQEAPWTSSNFDIYIQIMHDVIFPQLCKYWGLGTVAN
jgi:hypothetical protein